MNTPRCFGRQRRLRGGCSYLLLVAGLAACRTPATQLVVTVDTDIDRPLTVSAVVLRGAVEPRLAAQRAARDSVALGVGALRPPASFTVIPASPEERGAFVTVLLRVSAPATATQSELAFERTLHGVFVSGTRQNARVFLRGSCNTSTTGCASPSVRCSLARRCTELGLTCDDDGVCGSPVLRQSAGDEDVSVDRATRDATAEDVAVTDGSSVDASFVDASEASVDAVAFDVPSDEVGVDARGDVVSEDAASVDSGAASVLPPRQVAPLSGSRVTSRRPTLRFEHRNAITGARIEWCADRTCAAVVRSADVLGTDRYRVGEDLAPGWHYWRVRFAAAGQVGTQTSPVWQLWVGARSATGDVDTTVGTIADFNGDGLADVVVGSGDPGTTAPSVVRIFAGHRSGVTAVPPQVLSWMSSNHFGKSATAAGDVNGDGFVDLVVGAFSASLAGRTRCGAALVFHGGASGLATTPATVIEGLANDERLGMSVAGVGDVNGDGYGDIVAGGSYADTPRTMSPPGVARLYFGAAAGVQRTSEVFWQPGQSGDWFGFDVAGVGDVNGDGLSDFAVHSPWADVGALTDVGRTLVVLGRASFTLAAPTRRSTDGVWYVGERTNETFGNVHGAGDLNGDGYSDVVMYGDEPAGDSRGSLRVFRGGAAGLEATPVARLSGVSALDQVGFSASLAGDVDNDGYDDLLVGAVTATQSSTPNAGYAALYAGAPSTTLGPSRARWNGLPIAPSYFGHAVAIVGDTDGDRVADIAIGEPLRGTSAVNAGRVHFARGGASVTLGARFDAIRAGEMLGFSLGR